jgi:hypothetical protein
VAADLWGDLLGAKTDLKLWATILAGPTAWVAQLGLSYPIAQLTCHAGFAPQHPGTIHAISIAALGVIAAGAFLSWPLRTASAEQQRVRFMAQLGLLMCALFMLVVLATWVPPFIMNNCEG